MGPQLECERNRCDGFPSHAVARLSLLAVVITVLVALVCPCTEAEAQTFPWFVGLRLADGDSLTTCDDLNPYCEPFSSGSTTGFGIRVIELYWVMNGRENRGARFILQFPADWRIRQLNICDGVKPIALGNRPGDRFEFDFGQCRDSGSAIPLGILVINVRSRGFLAAMDQEVRDCAGIWHSTLGGGQLSLGMPCSADMQWTCTFCGPNWLELTPQRFDRVVVAGNAPAADTLTAQLESQCNDPYVCASQWQCYGGIASTHVRPVVYDAAGRFIDELVDSRCEAGKHTVIWSGRKHDGRSVPPGVFLARLGDDNGRIAVTKFVAFR